MPYCTPDDIAPYVKPYTAESDGMFSVITTPTDGEVEEFIEDVSALVDLVLEQNNLTAAEGTALYKAVVAFVKGQVADLVLMVNQAGRFGPTGLMAGERPDTRSAYTIITADAERFLSRYADKTGVGGGKSDARIIMV